jgi:regulator of RNase E activity RraA
MATSDDKTRDIVVGDRDGVVVIPSERLDDVIYQCEMVADVEAQMLKP